MASGLKRAGWTKPFWWLVSFPVAAVLFLYARLVRATLSVREDGPGAGFVGAAVYVNWHRHLPYLCVHHGEHRRWMLVSRAPYMDVSARFCRWLGVKVARGASGEGAQAALLELEAALARGESVTIAVDGPSGPAMKAKPGCVELARRAGVPVIAVAVHASRSIVAERRWDRMSYVSPFAKVVVRCSAPVMVPAELSTADALLQVEEALMNVERALPARSSGS